MSGERISSPEKGFFRRIIGSFALKQFIPRPGEGTLTMGFGWHSVKPR